MSESKLIEASIIFRTKSILTVLLTEDAVRELKNAIKESRYIELRIESKEHRLIDTESIVEVAFRDFDHHDETVMEAARKSALRWLGLKRSVSTPRATTLKRSKPQDCSSADSACVGTVVQEALLWNLRR